MEKRQGIFLLLMVGAAAVLSGTTWSYSLGISAEDLQWGTEDGSTIFQETILGLNLRGSAVLPNSGFYYGTVFVLGTPLFRYAYDDEYQVLGEEDTPYELFNLVAIPMGYRWEIAGGRIGLYLGGGPAGFSDVDFQGSIWATGAVMAEFGFETLKTQGLGWSAGMRTFVPLGSVVYDGSRSMGGPTAVGMSMHAGVSWTGER